MEDHIYNLLTYLIIFVAVIITGKKFWKKNFGKKEDSSCSSGCGGCATKCDLKELVNTNKTT